MQLNKIQAKEWRDNVKIIKESFKSWDKVTAALRVNWLSVSGRDLKGRHLPVWGETPHLESIKERREEKNYKGLLFFLNATKGDV